MRLCLLDTTISTIYAYTIHVESCVLSKKRLLPTQYYILFMFAHVLTCFGNKKKKSTEPTLCGWLNCNLQISIFLCRRFTRSESIEWCEIIVVVLVFVCMRTMVLLYARTNERRRVRFTNVPLCCMSLKCCFRKQRHNYSQRKKK